MTLLIEIPDRGELRHPLPADLATACRIVGRLAQVVPLDGIWSVETT